MDKSKGGHSPVTPGQSWNSRRWSWRAVRRYAAEEAYVLIGVEADLRNSRLGT